MKNLATLKRMNSEIWQARNAYREAVAENLKETGELRVISDDYDEDMGYPEGVLLSVPNRHFDLVDCVYDRIRVNDKGAIEVHICYFDDGSEDSWEMATELNFDDLDCIIDGIQWPDKVKKGKAEGKLVGYMLFEESLFDYELIGRHFTVFETEQEALEAYKRVSKAERKYAKDNEWEIGHDDKDGRFESYPEGSWGTSHTMLEIHEVRLGEQTGMHL